MIKVRPKPVPCQLHTIPKMSGGYVDLGSLSLKKRIKFWLKRNLSARIKRRLKKLSDGILSRFRGNRLEIRERGGAEVGVRSAEATSTSSASTLQAGDLVHVRSRTEIQATLDEWNELKGCAVMPDMWQYCGTPQRVFRVVERFVDERDYRLKKGTGIVLLVDLTCQGTEDYGRCDRGCFYFWRVEWLERIENV